MLGLIYPIKLAAAACKPGVLVKISREYPIIKPKNVKVILLVPNGNHKMNVKYT
jgi:hypothetical protein